MPYLGGAGVEEHHVDLSGWLYTGRGCYSPCASGQVGAGQGSVREQRDEMPANMFCSCSPGGSEELGCLPGGCVGDGHVDSWGQMPWFLAPLRQGSGDWCVERLAGKLAAAAQLRRGQLLQLGPLSLQGSQLEQPPPIGREAAAFLCGNLCVRLQMLGFFTCVFFSLNIFFLIMYLAVAWQLVRPAD